MEAPGPEIAKTLRMLLRIVFPQCFFYKCFQTYGKVERIVQGRTPPRFYSEGFAIFALLRVCLSWRVFGTTLGWGGQRGGELIFM